MPNPNPSPKPKPNPNPNPKLELRLGRTPRPTPAYCPWHEPHTCRVAAPRHNPKAPEEYLPSPLTLAPLTLALALTANPGPAHAAPALRQVLIDAACVVRAARPTVVVPRPPGGGETGRCHLPEPLTLAP